ncbi:hypothetical protein SAMN04487866_10290 [Thermoactinomyces sp. DSM 45891]|uniref:nuclear transport factor 2 family protein n=1 Tax=Thermoactinomyces sp. DSM 45891 TaxID=1761907 RepID=UPI000915CC7D|nr:nuclear transport factor 2 family protein [Thermoactinomyces sp. DSM 45891]SFX19129.1 hypothetical protein SAMN04487866_10290 [Thermoactinomyces sp. DSM 45891]
MKNTANREIAETLLAALGKQDWKQLQDLMNPSVQWTLPGTGVISGTAVGVDAVIDRFKAIANGNVSTKLQHILVGQHGLTITLHNTATAPDGRILDEHLASVLTVEAGLIIQIDTYISDVPMMEQFFAK